MGLADSEAFAHFGSCSSGKVAKSGQTTWVEGSQEGEETGKRRGADSGEGDEADRNRQRI